MSRWVKTGLSYFTLIFLAPSSYSQGEFLDKGTSGFGLAVGFFHNTSIEGAVYTLGYSGKGIQDISLAVSALRIYSRRYVAVAMSYDHYVIKQDSAKAPLSLIMGGTYEITTTHPSVTAVSLRIALLSKLNPSRIALIVPTAGFVYSRNVDPSGQGRPGLFLGLAFGVKLPGGEVFAVSPGIVIDEDYGTPGITASLVIANQKRSEAPAESEEWDEY